METSSRLLSYNISFPSTHRNNKNRRRRTLPSRARSRRPTVFSVATEPKPSNAGASSRPSPPNSINGSANRFGNVSEEIRRVRAQMEEDEQLASLMRGLRGQNLRDSQFADENVQLRLVEVPAVESDEALPLVYGPDIISAYWGRRPRAVATRIVQLLSVAGSFLSHLASDLINKKVKEPRNAMCQSERLMRLVVATAREVGVDLAGKNALPRYDDMTVSCVAGDRVSERGHSEPSEGNIVAEVR